MRLTVTLKRAYDPAGRGDGPRVLVDREGDCPFLGLHLERRDLVLEVTALLRGGPALLAAERVLVARPARDAVLDRQVLGRHRHRKTIVAVGQRLPEGIGERGGLPQAYAETQPAGDVRRR